MLSCTYFMSSSIGKDLFYISGILTKCTTGSFLGGNLARPVFLRQPVWYSWYCRKPTTFCSAWPHHNLYVLEAWIGRRGTYELWEVINNIWGPGWRAEANKQVGTQDLSYRAWQAIISFSMSLKSCPCDSWLAYGESAAAAEASAALNHDSLLHSC